MNEANREQADKCLEVAKTALRAGEVAKAERFALKAAKLFPNDEARLLMAQIKRAAGTAPSSSGGAAGANGHHQAGPSGMGTGPTLRRQRQQPARGAASRRDEPTDEDHLATPEQRELVKRIRATSEYYQVLQIERTATEDDVKKAYRRLALKLHPDKNKARGADEAFKAVSKAFTCLSDPVKRRHYDAHGREEGAGALGGGGGRHGGGGGGFYGGGMGDIDPEEIFNMFFGGNNPFMGGRMYTTGFGGGQQHRQAQAQAQARRQQAARGQASDANPLLQLAQLLPLVILLIFTFFSGRSQPAYSLKATREYRHPATTTTHQVVFYVQDLQQLQRNYPPGGRERVRLEHQIESEYRGALQQQCYNERMLQQRYHYYGRRDEAKRMELKSCDELTRRFGSRGAGAR